MALGMVQTGYGNSLCAYSVHFRTESDMTYAELLTELTTELELAFRDEGETVTDDGTGEDSNQTESHSDRKKEWEELLEQSILLEAMLRQMLENGLGQHKEEQKEEKKQEKAELDNEFHMDGVPTAADSKSRSRAKSFGLPGNSEFLQTGGSIGSEYFSPSGAGRRQKLQLRTICLTCETECDQKKQWKITE